MNRKSINTKTINLQRILREILFKNFGQYGMVQETIDIHRLVALAFIPSPMNERILESGVVASNNNVMLFIFLSNGFLAARGALLFLSFYTIPISQYILY